MSLITDRENLDFLLFDVLFADDLFLTDAFGHFDREAVIQILDTAQAIAEDHFLPFAAEADAEEPWVSDGKAVVPESTANALHAYADAGFFALPFPEAQGGLQAPWVLYMAVVGLFNAANLPVTNYAMLTIAAANLLLVHGSPDLQARFLAPMLEGRWFGTMCLSEPQAGSSLADIRMVAEQGDDGTYRLCGSKMWISGGEQEISENIVHMVLAKILGGPKGTKGISLFLVPKYRLDDAGHPADRNDIILVGLNHKMGQRGTTNCLLSFGDVGECEGYLIGEPHRGLEYMFHMMNEARIGVGNGAVASAHAAYLYAADYARMRLQGRPLDRRNPAEPQVPLIEHTDIKRLLMDQKAAAEGGMSLNLYCATLVDRLVTVKDPKVRKSTLGRLELLTPVAKSWPSEHCLEANKWAIQVLGGYGYSSDYPVERLYRDNRLNHIHEGTFGIQALDLLRRKIGGDQGVAVTALVQDMCATIEDAMEITELAFGAGRLHNSVIQLDGAIEILLRCRDVNRQLANATLFLDGFGTIVVGWLWLRQAMVATKALNEDGCSDSERMFLAAKQRTGCYFLKYKLAEASAQIALCCDLDTTVLDAPSDMF